jgi:Tfp pilus assembly protein PilF
MAKHCAICNKKLTGFESVNRWVSDSFHPELHDKPICNDCFRGLLRQQSGTAPTREETAEPTGDQLGTVIEERPERELKYKGGEGIMEIVEVIGILVLSYGVPSLFFGGVRILGGNPIPEDEMFNFSGGVFFTLLGLALLAPLLLSNIPIWYAKQKEKKKAQEVEYQSTILFNKGNDFFNMDKFDEAIQNYDKALEINRKMEEAWDNKGVALSRLGRFEEAVACYDKALELNPKNKSALRHKGNDFHNMGRFDDAIVQYNTVLQIGDYAPQFGETNCNKGKSLFSLGRFIEAKDCFDRATEDCPESVDAWYYKGLVEDILEQKAEAARSFQKVIELVPSQYTGVIAHARQRLHELGESPAHR